MDTLLSLGPDLAEITADLVQRILSNCYNLSP